MSRFPGKNNIAITRYRHEVINVPTSTQVRQAVIKTILQTNPLIKNATVVDTSINGKGNFDSSLPTTGAPSTTSLPPPTIVTTTSQPQQQQQQQQPRKKIPFEKGYSQMDWVRLSHSGVDLTGLGRNARPRQDVTLEEVRQHKTLDDCWIILRGKVYNLTPYLKFHPGGVDILKGVLGKDATALFNKYHAWVNAEILLEKCLVGRLASTSQPL